MKKWLLVLLLAFPLAIRPVAKTQVVYADDEIVEEIVDEQQEEEITEDTLKEKIEATLSQYLNAQTVKDIITWLGTSGVLVWTAKILTQIKKKKDMTLGEVVDEFKNNFSVYAKESIDKLGTEKIEKLTEKIEDLEKANETMMKVLVLMQDQTAKGKVALIDYLGSKTKSDEVKESVGEVAENIQAEEKKIEEIKAQVENDYKNIF